MAPFGFSPLERVLIHPEPGKTSGRKTDLFLALFLSGLNESPCLASADRPTVRSSRTITTPARIHANTITVSDDFTEIKNPA